MNHNDHLHVTFQHLLQGTILISLGLVIFKLFLTGKMAFLLAPKMIPFALFALVALLILGMYRLFNADDNLDCGCLSTDLLKNRGREYLIYTLFFIPIALSFMVDDFQLNKDSLANRGIANSSFSNIDHESIVHEIFSNTKDQITVTDDNYFKVMQAMNMEIDQLVGADIQIEGFIYRENDFKEDQAVIARQSMTCCIADSSIYGYMLEGDVEGLPTGSWYDVKGTIQKRQQDGAMMPVIKITALQQIEAPEEVFLYE